MSGLFEAQQLFFLEMRSFLSRYVSTGNPLVDMIAGCLLCKMLLALSNSITNGAAKTTDIFGFVAGLVARSREKHLGQLLFEKLSKDGKTLAQADRLSPFYKAIVYKLQNVKDSRVKKAREIEFLYVSKERLLDVIQEEPIEIEKDVFVKVGETPYTVNQGQQRGEVRYVTTTIDLYSDKFTADELKGVVKRWREDYDEQKEQSLKDRQLLFQVRFTHKEETTAHVDFHTHRSFDNFHFEHKELVLKEIEFFLQNRNWFEGRGLPYTLGILCYGEPGCGKTSFIKALLKYTNRHGVVFSINGNTKLRTLERMMCDSKLEDFPIPQEKRIYILEDIDAMGDIVSNRKDSANEAEEKDKEKDKDKDKGDDDDAASDIMADDDDDDAAYASVWKAPKSTGPKTLEQTMFQKYKKNRVIGMDDDSDWLELLVHSLGKEASSHLGFFLNILDGVIEHPGRIIIMTTNHVEKLDPALIRPGRIDLKLEFRRCTREVLKHILSAFYEKNSDEWELPDKIRDYALTPARVTQICRANKHKFEEALRLLEDEAIEEQLKQDKKAEAERAQDAGTTPSVNREGPCSQTTNASINASE